MRPLRVRGRPACEVSRAVLIKEIEALRQQITNLQETIRQDREIRYGPFKPDSNPADCNKEVS